MVPCVCAYSSVVCRLSICVCTAEALVSRRLRRIVVSVSATTLSCSPAQQCYDDVHTRMDACVHLTTTTSTIWHPQSVQHYRTNHDLDDAVSRGQRVCLLGVGSWANNACVQCVWGCTRVKASRCGAHEVPAHLRKRFLPCEILPQVLYCAPPLHHHTQRKPSSASQCLHGVNVGNRVPSSEGRQANTQKVGGQAGRQAAARARQWLTELGCWLLVATALVVTATLLESYSKPRTKRTPDDMHRIRTP